MGNLKFHDIHKLNELYCLDSNSHDKVPAIREPSGEQMPDITVTRADLAKALVEKVGLSQHECDQLVVDVLDQIAGSLVDDGEVKLSGFGSFKVVDKKERMGRNPRNGEDAVVSARRVVVFKAADNLKRLVNDRSE